MFVSGEVARRPGAQRFRSGQREVAPARESTEMPRPPLTHTSGPPEYPSSATILARRHGGTAGNQQEQQRPMGRSSQTGGFRDHDGQKTLTWKHATTGRRDLDEKYSYGPPDLGPNRPKKGLEAPVVAARKAAAKFREEQGPLQTGETVVYAHAYPTAVDHELAIMLRQTPVHAGHR